MRHVKLLLVALLLALLPGALMTQMASADSGHPAAPVGWKGFQVPAGAPLAVSQVTLPADQCAAMNSRLVREGLPSVPSCLAERRMYGVNHQAIPAGSTLAASPSLFASNVASAAAAYWYWGYGFQYCSAYGCWYWNVWLNIDGVANGSNVWKWNVGCTAGGLNTNCTWEGYWYNGGGWPYYAMEFGANSTSCLIVTQGVFCAGHGERVWINDYGNWYHWYAW